MNREVACSNAGTACQKAGSDVNKSLRVDSESTRNLPSLHPPGLRPDRPIPCFRFRSPSPSEVPAPARQCLPMLGPCHACQEKFPIKLPTRHSNNLEPQNCPAFAALGLQGEKNARNPAEPATQDSLSTSGMMTITWMHKHSQAQWWQQLSYIRRRAGDHKPCN